MMPARAWFAFYYSDWRGDPNLRACGASARGLWAEILCLMESADPPGYLRVAGKSLGADELQSQTGLPLSDVRRALAELEAKQVFSRLGDATIYSRRIIRREELRVKRAAGGKLSGNNPNVPPAKDTLQGYPSRIPSEPGKDILQGPPQIPDTRYHSSSLLAEFHEESHRVAVETALHGQHPQAVAASITALHDGTHRTYPYPVIGRALVELQAAGTTFSAKALDAFCRRILAGDPPPRLVGKTRQSQGARNIALLDRLAAEESARLAAEEADR